MYVVYGNNHINYIGVLTMLKKIKDNLDILMIFFVYLPLGVYLKLQFLILITSNI